ncbi:hypothetical protein, partial [Noviherbaspirillum denitrificans]
MIAAPAVGWAQTSKRKPLSP